MDIFATSVFSLLQSEFLVLPKGEGFLDYPAFERGYEVLKRRTSEFQTVNVQSLLETVSENPVAMIVIRTMLGFTPPEWAYLATQKIGTEVSQGFVRSLDRKIRMQKADFARSGSIVHPRILALLETACNLLAASLQDVGSDKLHRLDKADTREGLVSIRSLSSWV